MINLLGSIITDQSFLDLCIRLKAVETKMDWLTAILGAIAIGMVAVFFQNFFLHRQIKNGGRKNG